MTRYVVQNNINTIIDDSSYYLDLEGNQYPPNFPKSGLSGLAPITETIPPEYNLATQAISSSIELLNGVYTEVWGIRDLTQEELNAIQAAKDASIHYPSPFEFMRRSTIYEHAAIIELSKTDSFAAALLARMTIAPSIRPDDADTQQGKNYLISKNIYTPERADEIFI